MWVSPVVSVGPPPGWGLVITALSAALIVAFLVLFLVLIATETALTVWHYLKEAPTWVQLGYAVVLVGRFGN